MRRELNDPAGMMIHSSFRQASSLVDPTAVMRWVCNRNEKKKDVNTLLYEENSDQQLCVVVCQSPASCLGETVLLLQ